MIRTKQAWMILSTLLGFCLSASATPEFGPWSVSSDSPVVEISEPAEDATAESGSSLSKDYCFILLNFYQNVLSVVSISRCPMEPSCSNYSIDAINKHGAMMGIMMTADRLYHEGHEQKVATFIWRDGKPYFLDSVENNDFWWHKHD